jgi:DNA-binding response OmpR family regulator
MRVLAIEDNRQFLGLLRSHLTKRGFVVDTAETLADGLTMALDAIHDVVLLDLALPDGDGAGIVERLCRGRSTLAVIVMSARDAVVDRVNLVEAGADDYLVKPFDLDELVARIRTVVRRGARREHERLSFADVAFDQRNRHAIVSGRTVPLRAREASLLEALLRRAGEPIHRDQLLSSLYGSDEEIGSNTLDVHVYHLRRRLAEAGSKVGIATVRGHGYALRGRDS